jgi:hypothetical protein
MKILNETVFDSDDICAIVIWARDVAHKIRCERSLKNWHQYNKGRTPYTQPTPRQLPETLRIGYYSVPKLQADEEPRWASITGKYNATKRIGIARPTKFPLVAMEIIALAASDKDQRIVPGAVMDFLLGRLLTMFGIYQVKDEIGKYVADMPQIRYDHKPNKASKKAAQKLAAEERAQSLTKRIGWARQDVAQAEEKLQDARIKLNKLLDRQAKLEGKQHAIR